MSVRIDVDELALGDEPDAVPRARRFTAGLLRGRVSADLVPDAELVVTELVTNALLHAGPPVRLRIRGLPGPGVRIEVADPSRTAPIRALATRDAMTGRGLALVEALGHRWGLEPAPTGGKVVWCELVPGTADSAGGAGRDAGAVGAGEADVDALLAAWNDDDLEVERFTVRLGDVPTNLLVAAKAHVDNLVREFTLAAFGAASGSSGAVPAHLAELIETVVHRFAEAREAIKRQAVAAAERGEPRTGLILTLPASAAAAGEEYLAALDEADTYARASRLLTLETPPQHRIFRRWYVESLVQQLRRAALGQRMVHAPSFEERLLDEIGLVAAAQRATDRAARLQEVTAALAAATTPADVAAVVISEGVAALGAVGGSLLVPADGTYLTVPGAVGYGERVLDRLRVERRDAKLPAAQAMRTGRPVWLESRQACHEQFPDLLDMEPDTAALAAVPLVIADRVLGALRFSFDSPRLFDEDERRFVLALAAQTMQALDRAEIYAAERAARAGAEASAVRLARLQQVTAALTAARHVEEVADIVVTHAADALGASLATFSLLVEDETVRVIRMRGASAETAKRWRTFPLAARLPASEAVRTNGPVVTRTSEELSRRFPALAGQVRGERSLVCVPLRVGGRRLGVMSLSFPPDGLVDDPGELEFLTALADTCAQAIERAEALAEARDATDKLAFLAEASAELASSLDHHTILTKLAELVVPRLADWCTVHVAEDGEFRTLAVAHGDPARRQLAEELRRRCPIDRQAPVGIPAVVRTGRPELYPRVTDELLAAATVGEEHLGVVRRLGLASALVVPLTGRTGTFGALVLMSAESGRHYDDRDLAVAVDLARRAAVAVENAEAYRQQTGRLAAISRVAQAAQRAILAPVPPRVGPVNLAASYVSAAREALVGGDLYEVVQRPGGVRLLIGDVRGKGLDAVRTATVVLGEFRSAALDRDELSDVAAAMDRRLAGYLGEEDFVTALLAEIRDDGSCEVVCCGHPPALLARNGRITELGCPGSLPLGLGAAPAPVTVTLAPGERLLLYTDGIVEARDPHGRFVDLPRVVAPLAGGDPPTVLDRILAELRGTVGTDFGDDLALVVAEYRPG